jgi:WD40 repeat protein
MTKTFRGHTGWALDVCFFPNGEMLASTSADHTVRIWRVITSECVHVLSGHTGRVLCVDVSRDGCLLASGSDDHYVRIWNAKTGTCQKTLAHSGWVQKMAFSPDGTSLISTSDNTLNIWSIESGERLRTYVRRFATGWHIISFHADKSLAAVFITKNARNQLVVHTMSNGDEDDDENDDGVVPVLCQGNLRACALSHDGSTLAYSIDAAVFDACIHIVDSKTFRSLHVLKDRMRRVFFLSFSYDNRLLVAYHNKTICLWCVHTGNRVRTLPLQHIGFLRAATFSAKYLGLASSDNNVYLRRLLDVAALQTLALIMFRLDLPPYVILHIYNCWQASENEISIDTEDSFCHLEKITVLCTIQKRIKAVYAVRAHSAAQRNYTRARHRVNLGAVSSIEYSCFGK